MRHLLKTHARAPVNFVKTTVQTHQCITQGTTDKSGNYSANHRRALDRRQERKGYPNDIRGNGRKKQSKERKETIYMLTLNYLLALWAEIL